MVCIRSDSSQGLLATNGLLKPKSNVLRIIFTMNISYLINYIQNGTSCPVYPKRQKNLLALTL